MVQRRRAAPVTWHNRIFRTTASASLAAAAQVTVMDEALDHPTSGEDYGPGAIVGLRMWLKLVSGTASLLHPPIAVLMLCPVGLTVPTVNTDATMKQNEKYVWAVIPYELKAINTSHSYMEAKIALQTVRRFDKGDRLILVVYNVSAVALGALAEDQVVLDAYLRED